MLYRRQLTEWGVFRDMVQLFINVTVAESTLGDRH